MLINIQFLRFAAALAVVLFHAAAYLPQPAPWTLAAQAVGFAGVDVFFVISGFIMAYTTRHPPAQGRRGLAAAGFLERRLARIFTGYWPYLALALPLLWWTAPALLAGKDLLGSLLLLPVPIPERVIPVSWTLTYELYFYLLFALLLLLPVPWMRLVLPLLALLLVLINLVGVLGFGFYEPAFFQQTPPWLRLLISPYVLEFLAGALVCRLYLRGVQGLAWLALGGGLLLFALGGWYNHALLQGGLESGLHVVERVALFGPASVLLVYAAAVLERRGLRLWPGFSRLFGGASYSLYLSHTLLLGLFGVLWRQPWVAERGLEPWLVPALLGWIGLILLYSLWHYRYIEVPLYRLARRRLGVRE
jgi:exopolysaccharide production protein ExoZ